MFMHSTAGSVNDNTSFGFNIGGGLGIDIGISDLLTITPMYSFNLFHRKRWRFVNFPNGEKPIIVSSSDNTQHKLTIRLGIRIDYR